MNEFALTFNEEQKFGLWLRIINVLSMIVVAVIVFLAHNSIPEEQINTPIVICNIAIGFFIPLVLALLFAMLKLQTQVRDDGLYVRFFPFHIKFKKFTKDQIAECCSRTYRPIHEYGGWGIRFGKSGKAYNVSGNQGVQLVLSNGKKLLIGSQRPEELASVINALA
jgi:hypothetical protein